MLRNIKTLSTLLLSLCTYASAGYSRENLCSWGVEIAGEIKYWQHGCNGSEWLRDSFSLNGIERIERYSVDFRWRPGFVIELDHTLAPGIFTLFGSWTWYGSSRNVSHHIQNFTTGTHTLRTPRDTLLTLSSGTSDAVFGEEYDFLYSRVDLGVKANCALAGWLAFQPHISLTYLHTRDTLLIFGSNGIPILNGTSSANERYLMRHDGIGIASSLAMRIAIGGTFFLKPEFGLASYSAAVHSEYSRRSRFFVPGLANILNTTKEQTSVWQVLLLPYSRITLDWECCFLGNQTDIQFGWEYRAIFNETEFVSGVSSATHLQGFFLRCATVF